MITLTQEQIDSINQKAPSEQGIFFEPFGCDGITELLVYMRWETGGMCGGNYHEYSNLHRYESDECKPQFKVLDLILKELCPYISFLQFREIEELIVSTDSSDYPDYYGNFDEYGIEYIKLSDLLLLIETFLK